MVRHLNLADPELFCREQLESSLAEKSRALESVQGLKSSLEDQLKDALSSKVRSITGSYSLVKYLPFLVKIANLDSLT